MPIFVAILVGCGSDTVTVPGEEPEFADGRTLVQLLGRFAGRRGAEAAYR